MNEILKKIDSAKHIEIVVEQEKLFVATALYTYILTLHKKVSLVCKEKKIEVKYSFLPWFEKIKTTNTPSADLNIFLDITGIDLYEIFKNSNIKINKKIATSLYSAILDETQGFMNAKTDGMIFAVTSELIKSGAEHNIANKFIIKELSLAELRLKSLMLNNMQILNNTTLTQFLITKEMLKKSGADINIAKKIILEGLRLPYIKTTTLINDDKEIILKIDKEI